MTTTTTARVGAAGVLAHDTRSWQGSSTLTQVRVLTTRSLRSLVSDPRTVAFGVIQPLIMLVLFSQVFGNMIDTSALPAGVTYMDYLIPAILVNTAMQSALQTGVGLTQDLTNGVVSRFRAMPIRMGTVLVARSVSDIVRGAVQLALMVLVAAVLFDFSPAGGALGVVCAGAIALALGWGLGWLFLAMATRVRDAEAMQTVGITVMFPLMFASSAFVTVESLPGWLQAVATVNPMTYAVDAARNAALGTSTVGDWVGALLAVAVMAVVGAVVAVKGIRKV